MPVQTTFAEISNVRVSVSNSVSGSPGTFCGFEVTLPLMLPRFVFACGGAAGRYVYAERSSGLGLPSQSNLEAYLYGSNATVGLSTAAPRAGSASPLLLRGLAAAPRSAQLDG